MVMTSDSLEGSAAELGRERVAPRAPGDSTGYKSVTVLVLYISVKRAAWRPNSARELRRRESRIGSGFDSLLPIGRRDQSVIGLQQFRLQALLADGDVPKAAGVAQVRLQRVRIGDDADRYR
jgi:hypothetical protein